MSNSSDVQVVVGKQIAIVRVSSNARWQCEFLSNLRNEDRLLDVDLESFLAIIKRLDASPTDVMPWDARSTWQTQVVKTWWLAGRMHLPTVQNSIVDGIRRTYLDCLKKKEYRIIEPGPFACIPREFRSRGIEHVLIAFHGGLLANAKLSGENVEFMLLDLRPDTAEEIRCTMLNVQTGDFEDLMEHHIEQFYVEVSNLHDIQPRTNDFPIIAVDRPSVMASRVSQTGEVDAINRSIASGLAGKEEIFQGISASGSEVPLPNRKLAPSISRSPASLTQLTALENGVSASELQTPTFRPHTSKSPSEQWASSTQKNSRPPGLKSRSSSMRPDSAMEDEIQPETPSTSSSWSATAPPSSGQSTPVLRLRPQASAGTPTSTVNSTSTRTSRSTTVAPSTVRSRNSAKSAISRRYSDRRVDSLSFASAVDKPLPSPPEAPLPSSTSPPLHIPGISSPDRRRNVEIDFDLLSHMLNSARMNASIPPASPSTRPPPIGGSFRPMPYPYPPPVNVNVSYHGIAPPTPSSNPVAVKTSAPPTPRQPKPRARRHQLDDLQFHYTAAHPRTFLRTPSPSPPPSSHSADSETLSVTETTTTGYIGQRFGRWVDKTDSYPPLEEAIDWRREFLKTTGSKLKAATKHVADRSKTFSKMGSDVRERTYDGAAPKMSKSNKAAVFLREGARVMGWKGKDKGKEKEKEKEKGGDGEGEREEKPKGGDSETENNCCYAKFRDYREE